MYPDLCLCAVNDGRTLLLWLPWMRPMSHLLAQAGGGAVDFLKMDSASFATKVQLYPPPCLLLNRLSQQWNNDRPYSKLTNRYPTVRGHPGEVAAPPRRRR